MEADRLCTEPDLTNLWLRLEFWRMTVKPWEPATEVEEEGGRETEKLAGRLRPVMEDQRVT